MSGIIFVRLLKERNFDFAKSHQRSAIMYIVDDICYAGNPCDEVRVVQATPLKGGMLLVLFSSGEKKLFDALSVEGSAFEPLKDESIFTSISVQHGFVSWADGAIDLAPEYIYDNSVPYSECDDLLECA